MKAKLSRAIGKVSTGNIVTDALIAPVICLILCVMLVVGAGIFTLCAAFMLPLAVLSPFLVLAGLAKVEIS